MNPCRQPNVDDVRVTAVINRATPHSPWRTTGCLACSDIGDAAERPNEIRHVVAQPGRARRVLDTTPLPSLAHGTTVCVQKPLQYSEPNRRAVMQIHDGDELRR